MRSSQIRLVPEPGKAIYPVKRMFLRGQMRTESVEIRKPAETNVIIGQAHFIKTAEDLYEALVTSSPGIRFGLAFCEASGDRLVRSEGNE